MGLDPTPPCGLSDPTTLVPSDSSSGGVVSNCDAMFLTSAATINPQAPTYKQPPTAGGPPPPGLPLMETESTRAERQDRRDRRPLPSPLAVCGQDRMTPGQDS